MDKKTLHGDGVIIGTGTIYGAPICVFAQDFTELYAKHDGLAQYSPHQVFPK